MNWGAKYNKTGMSLINAIKELIASIITGDFNVGVSLNDGTDTRWMSGSKSLIETGETLTIPEHYEYNVVLLTVDGIIECDGDINIID